MVVTVLIVDRVSVCLPSRPGTVLAHFRLRLAEGRAQTGRWSVTSAARTRDKGHRRGKARTSAVCRASETGAPGVRGWVWAPDARKAEHKAQQS